MKTVSLHCWICGWFCIKMFRDKELLIFFSFKNVCAFTKRVLKTVPSWKCSNFKLLILELSKDTVFLKKYSLNFKNISSLLTAGLRRAVSYARILARVWTQKRGKRTVKLTHQIHFLFCFSPWHTHTHTHTQRESETATVTPNHNPEGWTSNAATLKTDDQR